MKSDFPSTQLVISQVTKLIDWHGLQLLNTISVRLLLRPKDPNSIFIGALAIDSLFKKSTEINLKTFS